MIPKILENIILRVAAMIGGFFFAVTGDHTYLILCAIYLIRNLWLVVEKFKEYETADDVVDTVKTVLPNIENLIGPPDKRIKRTILIAARFQNFCRVLPPIVYSFLGYCMSSNQTFLPAAIITGVLLASRVYELVLAEKLSKNQRN